jgi:hypothetical protein
LSNEEVASAAADTSLQTRISNEEVARAGADSSLETRLSDEEVASAAADSSLETRLSTEEVARDAADTSLETVIANLQVTFNGGDMSLTGDLTVAGDAEFNGTVQIPRIANQTDLNAMVAAQANGMMFYLAMADDAVDPARAGFEDGHKWYFYEDGVWHPSPFTA